MASGVLVGLTFRVEAVPAYTLLVAIVPLLLFLKASADDRRRCLMGVAVFVLVEHALLGYWVYALAEFAPMAVPIFVGITLWLGVFPMLFALAARRVLVRTGWPLSVVVPPLWVAADLLRSVLPLGMRGPDLAYAAWKDPVLIQTADLWGAFGVTFVLVLVNALLADLAWTWKLARAGASARAWLPWTVALAAAIAVFGGYGIWRLSATPVHEGPRVAVVQPNARPLLRAEERWTALERLTASAAGAGAEVVIWPEAALPGAWAEDERDVPARERAESIARSARAALLTGAVSYSSGVDGRRRIHNAAIGLDASGATAGIYRKSVLVPFVEADPWPGWNPLAARGPAASGIRLGGMSAGRDDPPIRLGPLRAGVMICYEQMFPGIARGHARAGADVLVGLTNDAWFDRSYLPYFFSGTIALRAVENRRPVVRAALTGISLFVDPMGRVEARTAVRTEALVVRRVTLGPPGATFYGRNGEVLAALATGGTVFLLLRSLRPAAPAAPKKSRSTRGRSA